jgi:hypothetical protein
MPPLYSVTLEFLQDGQPLADASVILHPEEASGKWFAGGTTDSQGKIKPATQGRYDGVAAGKYKVTVSKIEIDEKSIKIIGEGLQTYDSYHLVEPKFAEIAQTPLTLEVSKKGENFSFDAGAAVRKKTNVNP